MVWPITEPYLTTFWGQLIQMHPYPPHPFCAVTIKCHPSIPDGALFELCGIHKKMIALCNSTFCHGLAHHRAISYHILGPIDPNASLSSTPILCCHYQMPPIHT